jgi:hypothetical protein
VVWRPANGTFYWLTSSTGYSYASAGSKQWGNQGRGDRPFTGDFDGDRAADLAVWRPTDGTWYWLTSTTGFDYARAGNKQWGNHSFGDLPLLGDIDGDDRSDVTVWRGSTGTWHWLTSTSGFDYASAGSKQWGNQSQGDLPRLGDLDGDGKDDLTVWRESTGTWFWLTSSSQFNSAASMGKQFGNQSFGDVPMMR